MRQNLYFAGGTIEPIGGDSIYQIYIDTYFLFNFWMNLWVLFLCRFLLHSKVKALRIIAASSLAALGEAAILCFPIGNGNLKLILGFGTVTALVVAWLFRPGSLRYYYKILIYCYLSALILGSVLLILQTAMKKTELSVTTGGGLMVILFVLIKRICIKINKKSDFCQVTLVLSEQEQCNLMALIDSGNGLVEPISRNPVSLVEERVIGQYKKFLKEERFRLVPFHSVGNEKGILEAYFIDKIEIRKDGEIILIKNPIIAITKDVISANERYQMILHPELIRQGGLDCDF